MKSLHFDDLGAQFPSPSTPDLWTAVIPAAGRGSRLGYDRPKILYPIAGRPILDWIIDLLEPQCGRLVFVLSATGAEAVVPILDKRLPGRFEIVIQPVPEGMADAVWKAVPALHTRYTLLIWGDQVAIRPTTLQATLRTLEHTPEAMLTLPMVRREYPYVHYQTDSSGRLLQVLERREGASLPETGDSDCGLFAFRTDQLKHILSGAAALGVSRSIGTHEWNLLPLLPRFDTGGRSLCALYLDSIEESIGANNVDDAARLNTFLGRNSRG